MVPPRWADTRRPGVVEVSVACADSPLGAIKLPLPSSTSKTSGTPSIAPLLSPAVFVRRSVRTAVVPPAGLFSLSVAVSSRGGHGRTVKLGSAEISSDAVSMSSGHRWEGTLPVKARSGETTAHITLSIAMEGASTPMQSVSSLKSERAATSGWFLRILSAALPRGIKSSPSTLRLVVKLPPPSHCTRGVLCPEFVRVRWLGRKFPQSNLVVVPGPSVAGVSASTKELPSLFLELWRVDGGNSTGIPVLIGICRCPLQLGIASSPVSHVLKRTFSQGAWISATDGGLHLCNGPLELRNPLTGNSVGVLSIAVLQQSAESVDAVVEANDASIVLQRAFRVALAKRGFRRLADIAKRKKK